MHSPCFRRLQGKTQVFPGNESDFYRNRLTHSLEVAQIAKSIAIRLNATASQFKRKVFKIEPDIVEFAGLAHDLGHPPFGHNGEEALDECMRNHGGFEGNAQTLRIVAHLEKKATFPSLDRDFLPIATDHMDLRCGLNLTFRSLAALLKYDRLIPERSSDREESGVMKGYYAEDAGLVSMIKQHVLGDDFSGEFKTIECSIMDIADDIAYSTYDLEDNFKAGFLTPMSLFSLDDDIYDAVAATIRKRIPKQYPEKITLLDKIEGDLVRKILYTIFNEVLFGVGDEVKSIMRARNIEWSAKKMLVAAEVQALSYKLANDGYHRVKFTSSIVQSFLSGIEVVAHATHPQLHQVRLEFETFLFVEVLKNITYHAIIRSPGLQVVEYRGKDIVTAIFNAVAGSDGTRLLPDDFRAICRGASEMVKMRTICDFIAGMTDRYAFEFYGRLYGTNHLTIHKPL
ncbi:dGTP triphosphohydrolase [Methylocystis hirsuta]|uniref:dGTP triphosphohydrolase n=1 Tax=Methylocystis hirsuta TaxID=369798 RepID=UPI001FE085EF|nr:dNTP triphosphohydrolase [Methylocystis hirsuta]